MHTSGTSEVFHKGVRHADACARLPMALGTVPSAVVELLLWEVDTVRRSQMHPPTGIIVRRPQAERLRDPVRLGVGPRVHPNTNGTAPTAATVRFYPDLNGLVE